MDWRDEDLSEETKEKFRNQQVKYYAEISPDDDPFIEGVVWNERDSHRAFYVEPDDKYYIDMYSTTKTEASNEMKNYLEAVDIPPDGQLKAKNYEAIMNKVLEEPLDICKDDSQFCVVNIAVHTDCGFQNIIEARLYTIHGEVLEHTKKSIPIRVICGNDMQKQMGGMMITDIRKPEDIPTVALSKILRKFGAFTNIESRTNENTGLDYPFYHFNGFHFPDVDMSQNDECQGRRRRRSLADSDPFFIHAKSLGLPTIVALHHKDEMNRLLESRSSSDIRRLRRGLFEANDTNLVLARTRRVTMDLLCNPEISYYNETTDTCRDLSEKYGTTECQPGEKIKNGTGELSWDKLNPKPRECEPCSSGTRVLVDLARLTCSLSNLAHLTNENFCPLGLKPDPNATKYVQFIGAKALLDSESNQYNLYNNSKIGTDDQGLGAGAMGSAYAIIGSEYSTTKNARECKKHKTITECKPHEFTESSPSKIGDRVCKRCNACPSGQTRGISLVPIKPLLKGVGGQIEKFGREQAQQFLKSGPDPTARCLYGGYTGTDNYYNCAACDECKPKCSDRLLSSIQHNEKPPSDFDMQKNCRKYNGKKCKDNPLSKKKTERQNEAVKRYQECQQAFKDHRKKVGGAKSTTEQFDGNGCCTRVVSSCTPVRNTVCSVGDDSNGGEDDFVALMKMVAETFDEKKKEKEVKEKEKKDQKTDEQVEELKRKRYALSKYKRARARLDEKIAKKKSLKAIVADSD
eukprot:UC4_evm1s1113